MLKAVTGSTYVVHAARPVNPFPKNEQEMIQPAIQGTYALMRACTTHGVKRCVMTSGIVSAKGMSPVDKPDYLTGFYDESCWSNPDRLDGLDALYKREYYVERLAWDYVARLPENKRLELVTVLPTLVFGPSLLPRGTTQGQYMKGYFNPEKSVPAGFVDMVDVRDVSKIHLEAIRRPDAAGHRFVAHSERVNHHEIANALEAEFGPKGFRIC